MTQTAKVQQIEKTTEWEWKFGKMYSIYLKMDNWESIKLNKKKKDSFKIWDTISYEVVKPWEQWKEIQQDKPRKANNWQSQEWYFTSIAFQIWFQGFNPLDDNENFQARVLASRRIFSEMMDNYSNPDVKENGNTGQNTESPKADKKDDDDLPF